MKKYRIKEIAHRKQNVFYVQCKPSKGDLWHRVNHKGKLWGYHIIKEPEPFLSLKEAEDFLKRLRDGKKIHKVGLPDPIE